MRRREACLSIGEAWTPHQRWNHKMNIDLSGKTALITGSTAGIGLAIAKGLAATGANVVVNGRGQDKVDAAVKAIMASKPAGKISGVAADVSTEGGCNALVAAVFDVDILVNNT